MFIKLVNLLELVALVEAWTTPPLPDFRFKNTNPNRVFLTKTDTRVRMIDGDGNASDDSVRDLSSRRSALSKILVSGSFIAAACISRNVEANALDMDAFINNQLENDTINCDPKKDPKCIPKLTEDEALCKYGQSGEARGEACKRVKESGGKLDKPGSQGRSLGGAYAM